MKLIVNAFAYICKMKNRNGDVAFSLKTFFWYVMKRSSVRNLLVVMIFSDGFFVMFSSRCFVAYRRALAGKKETPTCGMPRNFVKRQLWFFHESDVCSLECALA